MRSRLFRLTVTASTFSALTLLVWQQQEHLSCKQCRTSKLRRFFNGRPVEWRPGLTCNNLQKNGLVK